MYFLFIFNLTRFLFQANNNKEKLGKLINDFWSDVDNFQSREGGYKERDYIYTNHADTDLRPYLWHKKKAFTILLFLGNLRAVSAQRSLV